MEKQIWSDFIDLSFLEEKLSSNPHITFNKDIQSLLLQNILAFIIENQEPGMICLIRRAKILMGEYTKIS